MRRRGSKRAVDASALEQSILVERLSKQYRLSHRPAIAALSGEPEEVDEDDEDDGDREQEQRDPWEGRIRQSRRARPQTVWALRDASFEVRRGSALGVVGGNGAGKSTLLRVLAGITPPTSGRVLVRGRVAPAVEFASAFLSPDLTGRQNVLLLAQVFGAPRKVAERAVPQIAEFSELGPLLNARAKTYSSGLYRRLAISIALNLEPDILLADEVFAGGDAGFRQRCAERLTEARRSGLTIVLASHNLDLLREHCDEGLWLDRGTVAARGPLEDVLRAYEESRSGGGRVADEAPPDEGPTRAARRATKRRSGSRDVVLLGGSIFGMDGSAVETLRTDEDALLALSYEVRTPGVEVQCVVALTADGEQVVELVQPSPARAAQAGVVTALVHLPAGSLRPSYYTALAGASVMDGSGSETSLIAPDAFSFEVYAADGDEDGDDTDPDPAAARAATWNVVEG